MWRRRLSTRPPRSSRGRASHRGSEVREHRPLGVLRRDDAQALAGVRALRPRQGVPSARLLEAALVELAELVLADMTAEDRPRPQEAEGGDRVGAGAAGLDVHAVVLDLLVDGLPPLVVDQGHVPALQAVGCEQRALVHDDQGVDEGVADSGDVEALRGVGGAVIHHVSSGGGAGRGSQPTGGAPRAAAGSADPPPGYCAGARASPGSPHVQSPRRPVRPASAGRHRRERRRAGVVPLERGVGPPRGHPPRGPRGWPRRPGCCSSSSCCGPSAGGSSSAAPRGCGISSPRRSSGRRPTPSCPSARARSPAPHRRTPHGAAHRRRGRHRRHGAGLRPARAPLGAAGDGARAPDQPGATPRPSWSPT